MKFIGFLRGLAAAALAMAVLCLVTTASAEVQAIQDFKRLCIDTSADPKAAFAAADAAGWVAAPAQGQVFASMSGNPDGRVIARGTPNFRALTVTVPVGEKPHKACFVIATADFGQATAALSTVLSQPPLKRTDQAWTWDLLATDHGLQSTAQFTPGQAAQLTLSSPTVAVAAVHAQTGGYVILRFTEDTVLMAPPPPPLPADAGDVTHFRAWIEQDGRHFPLTGEIHLQRRPFTVVFSGSHVLDYSIVSSLDQSGLAGKTTETDFQELFNRFGVGAEGDRDTMLFVNAPGDPPTHVLTNQFWTERNAGQPQRFQSYTVDSSGVATARRNIDTILVKMTNFEAPALPPTPISQWSGGRISILVTGRPPIKDQPHVDAKYAVIVFD